MGGLANRLWHATAFIANALANNYRLVHFYFDDYYEFFSESLDRKDYPSQIRIKKNGFFNLLARLVIRVLLKVMVTFRISRLPFIQVIDYYRIDQEASPYNLNNDLFIKKAKTGLVMVRGWLFKDVENEKVYKDVLVRIWTPNKVYCERIERFYEKYRLQHDILIGVHMRRGDYKAFEGGKWYYEQEEYYLKLQEMAGLKEMDGKKIGFVLCSNEKVFDFPDTEKFTVFFEERHFIEDLYLLAKCDYIFGPPSTFSIWASFYGNTPLLTWTKKKSGNFNC